jgi:hypothetical protein
MVTNDLLERGVLNLGLFSEFHAALLFSNYTSHAIPDVQILINLVSTACQIAACVPLLYIVIKV